MLNDRYENLIIDRNLKSKYIICDSCNEKKFCFIIGADDRGDDTQVKLFICPECWNELD